MPATLAFGAACNAPIGVFDSGIGGLSVLQALRAALPAERFVYLADTGHAPYGERGDAFVTRRTHTVARYLVRQHGVKALVVACNTATAAAMDGLRARYPGLLLIGVEPALKPAASATHTGQVAVMATRGTVGSARFARLLSKMPDTVQFRVQACDGLASAIEAEVACTADELSSAHSHTVSLCERYLQTLGPWGNAPGQADTLVLGCTHYVFAQAVLRELLGAQVVVLSTGEPVARQTQRLLAAQDLLRPQGMDSDLCLLSTGQAHTLTIAAGRWLGLAQSARSLSATGRNFK
ncbi:MAG: glutamate racemase [Giesbergeria sp.]